MWRFIVILACKLANKLSKLTGHEGSVIGGNVARKLDKKILKKIHLPKYVIGITGSSGKSSSTELTYNILTKNGYKVVYNKEGSNTINGITSLILNNSSLFGKLKTDVLLMELDEQFMKYIFEYITPTHLMITNITRDQPPRNSHPEKIYNTIKNAIPAGTHLILNVDDPFVNLYPYYDTNKWVTAAIKEELPWSEYARLNSKIYQYNSVIHRILMRYRSRNSYTEETRKGYEPLEPKELIKKLELEPEKLTGTTLSETKVARFDSILSRAEEKGIKMVIVDSPRYFIRDSINISKDKMEEISKKHGMLFIDNTHLPFFLEHSEMFTDPTHMNSNGAEIYTKLFLNQIHDYVSTIKN